MHIHVIHEQPLGNPHLFLFKLREVQPHHFAR